MTELISLDAHAGGKRSWLGGPSRCHPAPRDLVEYLLSAASGIGIQAHTVELKNSREARSLSSSAYGVFGVVYNGRFVDYCPKGGITLLEMLGRSDG